MTYPPTYRYTKEHEWIDVKGDLGTIGLTDYAQCQLGDIVFVELPRVGAMLEAEKPLGVVESVKTANEIYAPVSGEVIAINEALSGEPGKINADPMGEGWFLKLRIANAKELDELMDEAAYQSFVEGLH